MRRGESVIDASGLVKELGGRRVVDDVSLSVARGECVALVGANGAGKSTLLRMLVRLVEPDEGSMRIHGVDARDASAAALRDLRRRTGFVFQHHDLVGRASVLTNVVHGALGRVAWWRGWAQGIAPAALREEAMGCLGKVGLSHVARQRADRLSGGQSQRVAIARALMQRPALLLADREPRPGGRRGGDGRLPHARPRGVDDGRLHIAPRVPCTRLRRPRRRAPRRPTGARRPRRVDRCGGNPCALFLRKAGTARRHASIGPARPPSWSA
jgi:ABC-type polar amino acid transport system ATPase subunit